MLCLPSVYDGFGPSQDRRYHSTVTGSSLRTVSYAVWLPLPTVVPVD